MFSRIILFNSLVVRKKMALQDESKNTFLQSFFFSSSSEVLSRKKEVRLKAGIWVLEIYIWLIWKKMHPGRSAAMVRSVLQAWRRYTWPREQTAWVNEELGSHWESLARRQWKHRAVEPAEKPPGALWHAEWWPSHFSPLLDDVDGEADFASGAELTSAHRRATAARAWCPYRATTLMGSWQEKKSGEEKGANWRGRKSSYHSHGLNLTSYAWTLAGRNNEAQSERLIAGKYDAYSEEGNSTPLQYSCLENPMDGGAWKAAVHGWGSDTTERLHFHALEKAMATYSSVLAWRIPGTGEPGGLPSMGSHRVRHDWSDLAAAAAAWCIQRLLMTISGLPRHLSGKESAWINKQENWVPSLGWRNRKW